jgi:hypothetical protein
MRDRFADDEQRRRRQVRRTRESRKRRDRAFDEPLGGQRRV